MRGPGFDLDRWQTVAGVPLTVERQGSEPRGHRGSAAAASAHRAHFDGEAVVGHRSCRVRAERRVEGIALTVEGAGRFVVHQTENLIRVEASEDGPPGSVEEALCGPALVLFLAQRSIFCLHASAVRRCENGVLAFSGDSGAGKSTLCKRLAAMPEVDAVADDVLPAVFRQARGVEVRPDFPQLKLLPRAMGEILALPPRLSLDAVCLLDRGPVGVEVGAERLPDREALAAVVHQTIGSRLFDRQLLAAHLEFAARFAMATPCLRLTYPSHEDVESSILDAIGAEL